mgnify:CR=1 FL=1
MTQTKLLIAASQAIPESIIKHYLHDINNFDFDVVSYVDANIALRKAVLEIWPKASPVSLSATSLISPRRAIDGCTHLVLLWDGEDLSTLLFEARIKKVKTKLIPVQITKVVNKQVTENYDMYIGRGTPWGNPFAIGHGEGPDRSDVIDKYKEFFKSKISSDESFKRGILGMRGLRLACFCKPAPCHGDVIAKYLNTIESAFEESNSESN